MYAILLLVAAVLPPPMPDLPPPIKLDPTPAPAPACVVCKGTGYVFQGNGNKVPCPEDHATARTAQLEFITRLASENNKLAKQVAVLIQSCPCEAGGVCTCKDGCKCKDCKCKGCPGKRKELVDPNTMWVLLPVCDSTGCRVERVLAEQYKPDGYWYAKHAEQWSIYKDRKWQKIAPATNGSYRIEKPSIKTSKIVSDPLNGYVQIGRLGKPALTYARRAGQHSHRCGIRGCGHVWSHYPGQSHRCPSCGGLTSQNYVQINSGSYRSRVVSQPRRMSSRRSSG